jgi:hypothetical protein
VKKYVYVVEIEGKEVAKIEFESDKFECWSMKMPPRWINGVWIGGYILGPL